MFWLKLPLRPAGLNSASTEIVAFGSTTVGFVITLRQLHDERNSVIVTGVEVALRSVKLILITSSALIVPMFLLFAVARNAPEAFVESVGLTSESSAARDRKLCLCAVAISGAHRSIIAIITRQRCILQPSIIVSTLTHGDSYCVTLLGLYGECRLSLALCDDSEGVAL